jgi:opacity protein-like surface antigen
MLALAAASGLGLQAQPAGARDPSADDYSPYAPSGFFVFDWTGYYVGGHLGFATVSAEAAETIFPNSLEFFESATYGNSGNSVTGGVQAGWQRQMGKLVAGVEAGFTLLSFDNDKDSPLVPGLVRSAELSDIFTFTGRLGYADGRILAYAKGGLATAEVDVRYHDTISGASSSSSGVEAGWTAGAGIEYALTHQWVLGVEYNYLHFHTGIEPPTLPDIPVRTTGIDVDTQNVVLRLNYRFGPCCTWPAGPGPAGPGP